MGGSRVVFFHVNSRHHSLAIMGIPGMRGLHHLMLQVGTIDDVGSAHDLCADRGIPLAMTLGRHTNDRMFSFYLRSPSGFEIEYGWGAETVDDEDQWVVTHMQSPSIWGHRPGNAGPRDAWSQLLEGRCRLHPADHVRPYRRVRTHGRASRDQTAMSANSAPDGGHTHLGPLAAWLTLGRLLRPLLITQGGWLTDDPAARL